MEIVSKTAEGPIDVIDLGDISDQLPSLESVHDLEVSDDPIMLPGSQVAIVPGTDTPPVQKKTNWKDDGDHSCALEEIASMIDAIPQHSGQTLAGVETAIDYLQKCYTELRKANKTDHGRKMDEHKVESLYEKLEDMIERLEDAWNSMKDQKSSKRKKKASIKIAKEVVARIKDGQDIQHYVEVQRGADVELLPVSIAEPTDKQVGLFVAGEKEAKLTKEAHTAKIYLFEDPFLHSITRILINSHVSAGRDIEVEYAKLKKKYAFTDREELSIQELLLQKGLPFYKDLGRLGEQDPVNSKDGVEFMTEYVG